MGDGLESSIRFLFTLAIIGFIGIIGGMAFGLFKLIRWLF